MTASQASESTIDNRESGYAGSLRQALKILGHDVTIGHPLRGLPGDYDEYSAVLVGIGPVTSMSANYLYGALGTIESLWKDPKLSLFIDAPNPAQIASGLASAMREPDRLFKPLFSKRKFYSSAFGPDRERIERAITLLSNDLWPTTLYPNLPWNTGTPDNLLKLPEGALSSLIGMNLDPVMNLNMVGFESSRMSYWASNIKESPWILRTAKTMSYNWTPFRENKGTKDIDVQRKIGKATGSLFAPEKDGCLWWSSRIMDSLLLATPIATEWRESGSLSPSWGILPGIIEDMTDRERFDLAVAQHRDYLGALPSQSQTLDHLSFLLNLKS